MKNNYAMVEFRRDATGKVIRELRNNKKLTQEVLSGFAGIARSHLAMIESGTKQPNFETVWAIANALELHPYELVKRIEQETEKLQENEIKKHTQV